MSSLFFDSQAIVDSLLFSYSLQAYKEFIDCADRQLTSIFIAQTGLKPGKNVCISIAKHAIDSPIYSEYIIPHTNFIGRKLCIKLYINHNWDPITIYWKSKKGIDYKLHDRQIDCNDIEFWFEKLDTDLYVKQLYPDIKLPFKTSHLPFNLDVLRLNIDTTLTLTLKEVSNKSPDVLIKYIAGFINIFKETSVKKGRDYGVVHNFKADATGKHIEFYLDLGSSGMNFIKSLLNHLA